VQICIEWRNWTFDMMSHFQDGGHDVRPPPAAVYASASADCPLAHRVHAKSLARRNRYSSLYRVVQKSGTPVLILR